MNKYIQVLAAFSGSAGFALAYHFRNIKHVLAAGLGGAAGWICYLTILHFSGNEYLAGFGGTLLCSFYSEAAARFLKTPATGLLILTSIPMIPGSSLFLCMQHLLHAEMELFRQEGQYTILFATCMASGFVLSGILVHLFTAARKE